MGNELSFDGLVRFLIWRKNTSYCGNWEKKQKKQITKKKKIKKKNKEKKK